MDSNERKEQMPPGFWLYDLYELRCAADPLAFLASQVGTVNPRPSGWHNTLIQFPKKILTRLLAWYTRPVRHFETSASQTLKEIICALESFSANMIALERRIALAENRIAITTESMRKQLDLLHDQVNALVTAQKTTNPDTSAERSAIELGNRDHENLPLCADAGRGIDRTGYIIGLFGSGRLFVCAAMLQNVGERAQYFRNVIELHPGPTSMIYTGHATMKYFCRGQSPPAIMRGILEAKRSRFADLIFIYRHPLDSLLTNWIWWRIFNRENRMILGISDVYKNIDDLCADLEQNFLEFKTFAEGDPGFFAIARNQPFLSFQQFVEETELHLQSATIALRFEDFIIDPVKEFSKILQVMSIDFVPDRLRIAPPRTKAFGYSAVAERVPRFREFIHGLDSDTRKRIERIGYST